MLLKDGVQPSCLTDYGCENSDVLSDYDLNDQIETYLKAKIVASHGNQELAAKIIADLEFAQDLDLLLEIETIFSIHMTALRKRNAMAAAAHSKR